MSAVLQRGLASVAGGLGRKLLPFVKPVPAQRHITDSEK